MAMKERIDALIEIFVISVLAVVAVGLMFMWIEFLLERWRRK
jgi:hypothetical protein